MFFETNQVNDILICEQCKGRLDLPKILPCGKTICSFCAPLNLLSTIDNKFDCLVCKNKHEVPRDGLPNNEALLKMLSIKPTRISRGKLFDSLQNSLDDIRKKNSFIEHGINNSNDLIKEYCMDLRSEVQLKTEQAIEQINELNKEIIDQIDEYEQELIEFNRTNSLDEFNKVSKELESFYDVNNEYLKQFIVDDEILLRSTNEATNLIKKAELEIDNLKTIIFDGRFLIFEKNNDKINKLILGTLKILDRIDSVILTDLDQFKDLMNLCEFPVDQKLILIYRASQDGFEASSFHTKCDNKPNTFIIIKAANGNVFGGYTEQSWIHSGGYKPDPNSFIFSLINLEKKKLKMKFSQNYGILCKNNCGPVFGGGLDLYISDYSNTNVLSGSNLGHSFNHPYYLYESNEARSFLAGSYNFQVSEIEVYVTKRDFFEYINI
jgi:hypothetical protein